MIVRKIRHILAAFCVASLPSALAGAQELGDRLPQIEMPGLSTYAPAPKTSPLATAGLGRITLAAQLVDEGAEITRGLVWRVFDTEPGPDGKLKLVASAKGGAQSFDLSPGQYLVHASYGRAGATKRISVGNDARREALVLDAGGLKLDAENSGGQHIPSEKLRFSIYEADEKQGAGERALILPDVSPNTVIRLNAGTYQVVSTYGNVNAVIRSDIKVEAGKLTEATVEHRAAEITMKLVRQSGGEAIADTSWSVQTNSGDPVRESVGAYASMVLAEGDYTIVAKNRDHIYQRDFTVEAGNNAEVEVIADESAPAAVEGAD
ncbi:hypothetical protein RB623_28305 [Mesorhizobium sp. LHD-90]|uniref:hypothetical protein n=1 Tax=Mesorhizobium sp. LHD-90 TaxID=3071414 RepID=UPI0027DFA3DD|nr:hypothetical protein [Mesorhizobium sp. LHD-90]MDQ6437974.1 hypothetical protein [Mesorhizobium sp. LHD-90]